MRTLLLTALVVLGLVAAGCGGSSQSPQEKWADGFCSAVTTWKGSISSATSSVEAGNVSKKSLEQAATDVESATSTFVDSLQTLGAPPTESGTSTKDSVSQLSTEVGQGLQKIKTAAKGVTSVAAALSAVSVASGTLSSMSSEISATTQQLQTSSSELQDAFKSTSSCKSLTSKNF
jgi:uncharacterized phage infection (PIP) family protein YhgE